MKSCHTQTFSDQYQILGVTYITAKVPKTYTSQISMSLAYDLAASWPLHYANGEIFKSFPSTGFARDGIWNQLIPSTISRPLYLELLLMARVKKFNQEACKGRPRSPEWEFFTPPKIYSNTPENAGHGDRTGHMTPFAFLN